MVNSNGTREEPATPAIFERPGAFPINGDAGVWRLGVLGSKDRRALSCGDRTARLKRGVSSMSLR
jgi:hypothetical protein